MMKKYENNQIRETTDDVIAHELADEMNDPTFVREYLKAGFLSSAVDALFDARRQAGLTQTQVANRLNTKQASIARLEADTSGSLTLRRYVEIALACDMVPLDITLAPIDSIRDFVRNHPDSPLTQVLYQAWLKAKTEVPQTFLLFPGEAFSVQSVKSFASPINTTTSTYQEHQTGKTVEQNLNVERKTSEVLSQLPSEHITMGFGLQPSNQYQQEVSQPPSTVDQVKEMAA
jgi:transcriptional regulator with XRE-family HTH domain